MIRYLLHTANHKVHSSEDREPSWQQPQRSATLHPYFPGQGSSPGFQCQEQDRRQGSCLKVSVPSAPPRIRGEPPPLLTILQRSNYSDSPSLDLCRLRTIRKQRRQCPDTNQLFWMEVSLGAPRAAGRRGAPGLTWAPLHLAESWGLAKHPVRTSTTARDHVSFWVYIAN